ncbi:hypothetical protein K0504_11305 [Neiella marina]|uniref:Glycosyltransferase n=1 Tax=Neiella holothuriorum TaxID=2870530 RepID=A0ABS7EH63_9GAMM|nr:hypothetical protein [Neiella holothuriorum]MBW8191625.1 hypothetical protein [Neiella holothuriorum]
MLGIVIPLKSKAISRDWQVTSDALAATLCSIAQQTSGQYQAVVVGHDIPEGFAERFKHIQFATVDFAVPNRSAPDFTHKELIKDKNLKIARGLQLLSSSPEIAFWYGLDSDDLLADDFVETVLTEAKGRAGLIIDGGFIVYQRANRVIPIDNLSLYCGSTSVVAREYILIPQELSVEGLIGVPWSRYPHMQIAEFFKTELKLPYANLKKPLLAYVLGSGDNISDKWRDSPWKALKAFLKPYLKGRKIGASFKAKFALK